MTSDFKPRKITFPDGSTYTASSLTDQSLIFIDNLKGGPQERFAPAAGSDWLDATVAHLRRRHGNAQPAIEVTNALVQRRRFEIIPRRGNRTFVDASAVPFAGAWTLFLDGGGPARSEPYSSAREALDDAVVILTKSHGDSQIVARP